MKKSYYNITLDIKGIQSQAVLRVKQFDTSRVIYMSLTDGGKPYTIGEKCYAVFEAIKPDGTKVGNNCYIEKNKIVYEITEQTVAVSGIANCEVSLYDADGGLITSPRFTLIIDRKLVTGDEFTSSSEYTSLVECLIRAEASEKEREDAEDERRDTWNTVLDSPKVWELKGGCIYRVSGFVAIDNEGVGFYVADKSLLVVNKDGDKTLFYLYLGGYGEYPYEIVTGTTDGTTSVWYGIESDKNKVSIINKNSTYVDYPSAKAVFDFVTEILENISVEGAEQTSNKVTEITEESTDEQYPTAKAVYDLMSDIVIDGGNTEIPDDIQEQIQNKQDVLVSGQNIKTINGQSILGEGDISISGGAGQDGADGLDGKDGVSATHSWNGTVLTVTSASGTSSADLKGEKGDKGDSYTLTEEDKEGIVAEVVENLSEDNIPAYWQDHLAEKISSIKALQGEGGKDCFSFVVIADMHYEQNLGKLAPTLAKKNSRRVWY